MLSHFKYFTAIALLVVSIIAFFAGAGFRQFAGNKVIRQPIEQQNIEVIKNFTKNIWCKYEPSFRPLNGKPASQWKASPELAKFGKILKTVFVASPSFKISLYLESKDEIATNLETDLILGDTENDKAEMDAAFNGLASSRFIPSIKYHDKSGALTTGTFVKSFVLLDPQNCPPVSQGEIPTKVVAAIYTDVTPPWDYLYLFQLIVSAGIITTFLLLYFALFITSKKTERIISKQHEEKLRLEKAKATAEAQNMQKSMFLANVSHELRTPLNAIIGFSDIIKDEVMGPIGHPQYKEYLNDINASGVHLLSLINDILDYSKAEAHKLEVEFVDVDISKISNSCLRLVEPRANQAKVGLVKHLPEKHIILSADPKRIKQVILNLLSNSIKFTQEGGSVELSIEEEPTENSINIVISDNGIGIAAKDIPKALAPFGQIDSSLSRKYEGTGLGLPLTKKLTEIMGGKFDIKSEVGLGTTITLSFPLI
jgi:two-component system cell cycle sensor histidine kinase PleC